MYDPQSKGIRKTWAFIMTLYYSRHRFVRFVFRMDIVNWIDCPIRAFEFLGGELKDQKGATPLSPRCTKDRIEELMLFQKRDLFSEIERVFFDTTSIYFE